MKLLKTDNPSASYVYDVSTAFESPSACEDEMIIDLMTPCAEPAAAARFETNPILESNDFGIVPQIPSAKDDHEKAHQINFIVTN